MKKLLVLLLISALAVFVGCDLLPPNGDGGEGEGEGEGEVEEVTVEIDGAVVVDGNLYVSGGSHAITVTFPNPVAGNVEAYITPCSGDYSKDITWYDGTVVLFPDADRKVWTGSGDFGESEWFPDIYADIDEDNLDVGLGWWGWWRPCCASLLQVTAGECGDEVCIELPVIVDSAKPNIGLKATGADCGDDDLCAPFAGCEVKFEVDDEECDEICCGDDCSGVGAWSIEIYKQSDVIAGKCCDLSLCSEPVDYTQEEGCPIEWTTKCLEDKDEDGNAISYYVFITVADMVGNKIEGFYEMTFDTDCKVTLVEKECQGGEFIDVTEGNESHLFDGDGCYSPSTIY